MGHGGHTSGQGGHKADTALIYSMLNDLNAEYEDTGNMAPKMYTAQMFRLMKLSLI